MNRKMTRPLSTLLHGLIENVPGAIFLVDKEGWILDCNKEAERKTAMGHEELLKERVFMLTSARAGSQLAISTKVLHKMNLFGIFASLRDDPSPQMVNIPLTTPSNEKDWYSFTISRFEMDGAEIFVLHAAQARESVLELDKNEESERKYRHLFDTQPFAMMIINEKMRVAECNFKMETLTGYPMGELVGLRLADLPFLRPGQADMLLDLYGKYLQSREVVPPVVPITTRDGREIHVEVNGTALAVGKKLHIQVITQDVTEKIKMQNMMEEENRRLKELDAMRKSFITSASHEIKTPLTSIDGASAFLAEKYPQLDDKQRLSLIDLVRRGSTRLRSLLEALLDFSRVENKEMAINLAPTPLRDVIRDAIQSLSFLFQQRQHQVDLDLEGEICILADRARLEQVLVNLLSNAAKNTPPRGRIDVNAAVSENMALISIHDNGIGIEPGEMKALFQKFGKIERAGFRADIDIQGPGIGLYITREIIALHGGKIWAESAGRGKGATFKFNIPLAGSAPIA